MTTNASTSVEIPQDVINFKSKVEGFNDCYCQLYGLLKDAKELPLVPREVKAFMAGFLEGMRRDQEECVQVYAQSLLQGSEVDSVRVETAH